MDNFQRHFNEALNEGITRNVNERRGPEQVKHSYAFLPNGLGPGNDNYEKLIAITIFVVLDFFP